MMFFAHLKARCNDMNNNVSASILGQARGHKEADYRTYTMTSSSVESYGKRKVGDSRDEVIKLQWCEKGLAGQHVDQDKCELSANYRWM